MEKKDAIILEKMLKAQSAYTQYARKLANKGFMYESMASKSHGKLVKLSLTASYIFVDFHIKIEAK